MLKKISELTRHYLCLILLFYDSKIWDRSSYACVLPPNSLSNQRLGNWIGPLVNGFYCHSIPSVAKLYISGMVSKVSCKMVDRESSGGNVKTAEVNTAYETVRDSFMRAIDEVAKAQPQYSQSISNLQLDYIQTVKNVVQTTFAVQKQYIGETWNVIPSSTNVSDQMVRQTADFTNNAIKAIDINNQLTINAIDAARENLKAYNRTVDTITEYNTNIAKAWNTYYSVSQQQQKQFFTKH
jgi:hypothetical protein